MAEPIDSHAPRFLLLRGGGIGDFIVTLPVLQVLREQWPSAHIEIWGYPHIAEVAVACGLAQSLVSLDRADMSRFFVPQPSFSDEQVAAVRSFDLLFNYLYDPVGQVRSNLLLAGAKQVLSGSPLIKRGHAVPFLLEPLQGLALYETERCPELNVPDELKAWGRSRLDELGLSGSPVMIHPGSGNPDKNWPLANFLEVAVALKAAGRETACIIGEADEPLAGEIRSQCPELPVIRDVTLRELSGILANASCYLGNDSGITHLAAAVGLPVTALFGPSDPEVWAPRGRKKIIVVRAPEGKWENLPVKTVWGALEKILP